MTYEEAVGSLGALQRFGMRPGLETIRALTALVGNPERSLRFVHVAGTNGKGSTCAMVESILRHAGYRVGLYTSPHLVRVTERIQMNRIPISDNAFAVEVSELRARIAEAVLGGRCDLEAVTFFEFMTAVALMHFARQSCDVVVWETGMGGRWDATNCVTPMVSVITSIGLDHMEWLGSTLGEIAGEKAGILKPGVPGVTLDEPAEACDVIRKRAGELGIPLRVVETGASDLPRSRLPGRHQRWNAALAVEAIRAIRGRFPVEDSAIELGLRQVEWAGRFQRLEWRGKTLILDGAHNEAGVAVLIQALEEEYPGKRWSVIAGMLADKNGVAMGSALTRVASRLLIVPVASPRSADPVALAAEISLRKESGEARVGVGRGLREALDDFAEDERILITGSLYFIGQALELLELGVGGGVEMSGGSERGLNEYGKLKTEKRAPAES